MNPFLVAVLLIVALLIAAGLYRVWAGPTVFDRLVAIALVSVNGVIVLVVLGFVLDRTDLFLDIALAYALLAFLLPIALGRYFEERDDGTSRDGRPSPSQPARPTGVVPHGLLADRGRRMARERARRHNLKYPEGEAISRASRTRREPDPDVEGGHASSDEDGGPR